MYLVVANLYWIEFIIFSPKSISAEDWILDPINSPNADKLGLVKDLLPASLLKAISVAIFVLIAIVYYISDLSQSY